MFVYDIGTRAFYEFKQTVQHASYRGIPSTPDHRTIACCCCCLLAVCRRFVRGFVLRRENIHLVRASFLLNELRTEQRNGQRCELPDIKIGDAIEVTVRKEAMSHDYCMYNVLIGTWWTQGQ